MSAWAAERIEVRAGLHELVERFRPADRLERAAAADRCRCSSAKGSRSSSAATTQSPIRTAGGSGSATPARARSAATCASAARSRPSGRLRYAGDGVSDRCAARRGRQGLRARLARDRARALGTSLRAVRDDGRHCCCAFLSRTTSRSRPSAFACSAPISRTSGTTARSTARSPGARCGSRRRPAASTSEPLDEVTRPVVEKLLGLEFELDPFTAWAAEQPVLAEIVARLPGFRPPLSPDAFESLVTSITSQQVSLRSAFAMRSRFIAQARRASRPRCSRSRRGSGSLPRTRRSSSRSASRTGRPST